MSNPQFSEWPNDSSPRFDLKSIPEGEQNVVHILESALLSMGKFCKDFKAALRIFDFCIVQMGELLSADQEENPEREDALEALSSWQFVAARDGAMTIFHFGEALAGARSTLQQSSTMEPQVDKSKLREAGRILEQQFPSRVAVRNSVGHAAQISHTPEAWDKHAVIGSYHGPGITVDKMQGAIVTGNLENRRYTSTWKGAIFTYDLSIESLRSLIQIKEQFYSAFLSAPSLHPLR